MIEEMEEVSRTSKFLIQLQSRETEEISEEKLGKSIN